MNARSEFVTPAKPAGDGTLATRRMFQLASAAGLPTVRRLGWPAGQVACAGAVTQTSVPAASPTRGSGLGARVDRSSAGAGPAATLLPEEDVQLATKSSTSA